MKLINMFEELSEFEPATAPTEAQNLRFIQTKIKSLSHHRAIMLPRLRELEVAAEEDKLTARMKQELQTVEARLKNINAQFKQFTIKVGNSKITNPLAICELSLYAGPVEGYPDLTGSQKKLYAEIQDALAKAGMQPLSILYGGRYSTSHRGICFVAVNADHTFAWRKHDSSPGAGLNTVYFSGAVKRGSLFNKKTGKWEDKAMEGKMNTSDFLGKPGKYLAAYKP